MKWGWLQFAVALALICLCLHAQAQTGSRQGLLLVYPKPNSTISAASTFLIGSVPAGQTASVNGISIKLNAEGYFAQVVPLKPGRNEFLLKGSGTTDSLSLTINREQPVPAIPPGALRFAPKSIEPGENLGLGAGELLSLAVKATPGNSVSVLLGNRRIVLHPLSKRGLKSINSGLDTAYGASYQRHPANSADQYVGFYRIQAQDRWNKVIPRFLLSGAGGSLQISGKAGISTVEQPLSAITAHANTIVRLGPGEARTTPLDEGVRMLVDGWQGNSMRCLLSPGRHVWIEKEDLIFDDGGSPPPLSVVRSVSVREDADGSAIEIPLSQRLPYQIEQQLNPNQLGIKIFGATSDTDWITPEVPPNSRRLLDHISWKQAGDRIYQVTAHLYGHRQWGFWAEYEGTTLVLHLKQPPKVIANAGVLNGITICLDAGHGGSETGSIGPSGIKESQVNLEITARLRDLLLKQGARVIMTRTSESENPSLAARPDTAIKSHATLLLSIHNNALPDGRDPWQEHGTSSYWYHPQSIELARNLKNTLVKELGFPDIGTRYQNLALCRPSHMPAVLVEVGFMINPDEYAKLTSPDWQQKAAEALLHGIEDYFITTSG